MCGFLVINSTQSSSELINRGEKSLHLLRYHGPDSQRYVIHDKWFLGHTQLSIIDPTEASNQPFEDPEGRYVLVFNGEIYNYLALKADLEKSGSVFFTGSDTEVLLELLKKFDIHKVLSMLRGCLALTC